LFGLTPGEIGVIFLVLFLAGAVDFWRGKLGKNITPKRLAIYGAFILLGAVFFWNTIESRSCDTRSFESRQPLATIHAPYAKEEA
jgi:hypothetical protein